MTSQNQAFKCCCCHSIKVQGTKVERIEKTGLSHFIQQKVIQNKQRLLQVRSGSVEILDEGEISVKRCSDTYCTIKCKKCNTTLNLYYGRGNAFAQFSVNRNRQIGQDLQQPGIPPVIPIVENEGGIENIPNVFVSLVKPNLSDDKSSISCATNEEEVPQDMTKSLSSCDFNSADDDDFDLMFSSSTAPIVGSYTESPMSFSQMIYA